MNLHVIIIISAQRVLKITDVIFVLVYVILM